MLLLLLLLSDFKILWPDITQVVHARDYKKWFPNEALWKLLNIDGFHQKLFLLVNQPAIYAIFHFLKNTLTESHRFEKSQSNSKTMLFVKCRRYGHRRRPLNNSFSAKQRLLNSRGKFKLAVITIATFTRGIQRLAITTWGRSLNIWRKRVRVESYLGEGRE